MKLISWNVNGLRAVHKKGFRDFVKKEKPNLLCIQETKLGIDQEELAPDLELDYEGYFSSAEKRGYSGVLTYVKSGTQHQEKKLGVGMGVRKFDSEGRVLVSHHKGFILYNTYFPSGTTGDERQGFKYKFLDSFLDHITSLPKAQQKRLVICGDFNICHREIDIHHPKEATKRELSGFLPDERRWMDKFTEAGFVDTLRHIHGDRTKMYSWWSYRAGARKKNLGWRIDYFFVSKELSKRIKNAEILSDVPGSDHCPIVLELELS